MVLGILISEMISSRRTTCSPTIFIKTCCFWM